ncbi:hypothetical protein DUI87_02364 [Hirundo rustica rustica]|uniref:Integrase-type domain-containing protein n=1 Tax=Hirundo rustica rustica TaxID=333673 RepID=A0A3M0L7Z5_HIRRU|nr:hypothetical protein DUI87_02364 [Hirundo rustica rustica]
MKLQKKMKTTITDDDIIRITASEGIPVRKAKTLEFSGQASTFLLSKDFMRQFFRQFSEAASEFQHEPMSSFSRIFLPRKGAAEKLGDAQQSLVPVLWEKEKETKQDEVKPQKQVDPGKDEAAAKLQTQQSIPESDKTQASGAPEFLTTDGTDIRKYALKGETLPMGSREPTPPIIRHFSNSMRAKLKENPLVLVRNPESGQIEGPFKLITWGKRYDCVSTAVGPKWLAARHVKPYRVQTQADVDPKTGGREVGTQTFLISVMSGVSNESIPMLQGLPVAFAEIAGQILSPLMKKFPLGN